jgi:hypothetical protein
MSAEAPEPSFIISHRAWGLAHSYQIPNQVGVSGFLDLADLMTTIMATTRFEQVSFLDATSAPLSHRTWASSVSLLPGGPTIVVSYSLGPAFLVLETLRAPRITPGSWRLIGLF